MGVTGDRWASVGLTGAKWGAGGAFGLSGHHRVSLRL